MRRGGRRRAGQAALLALALQLVLPWLTLHQATAAPGPGGAFVICTSAGLVWIDPTTDGSAPDGSPETAHHCPICFTKQLQTAVLPVAAALQPLPATVAATAPLAADAVPVIGSAPPLPARGPPATA